MLPGHASRFSALALFSLRDPYSSDSALLYQLISISALEDLALDALDSITSTIRFSMILSSSTGDSTDPGFGEVDSWVVAGVSIVGIEEALTMDTLQDTMMVYLMLPRITGIEDLHLITNWMEDMEEDKLYTLISDVGLMDLTPEILPEQDM